MASLASINVKFTADLKGFSTEMQTALRQVEKAGKQFQAIGRTMSTFVTLPILAAGAAAIKFASDYNESLNKVDVSFKGSSAEVKDFAKTSLESFGIAEGTALNMASAYGDMGTSMGLTNGQAAKMSTSLVGLAGDLASFKNISIDIANTAISAIFTGETESLKKLGIVMTEVNLKQFALNSGIKKNYEQMSQAEKVQLRYNYILSVTKNSQGDFIRTQGGAANQMRIFQESLKQLAQQFGSIVLPLFTSVIKSLNGMVTSFGNLSEGTKTTIIVIAAIAAAIGPLLSGIGGLLTFIPTLITKFAALNTVIIANPYAAAALAIIAIGTAIYAFSQKSKEAVSGQTQLNDALKKGNELATGEVASLDKLYQSATNVKLSTDERKKAVDQLQALYPAYFKNIDDEAIKNGTAKKSYDDLRDAIFNKSRAAAIDGQLQKNANDRIAKELKLRENITATEAEILRLRNGSNEIVLQEANAGERTARVTISKSNAISAQTRLLAIQNADLTKFNNDALKQDNVLLNAKQEYNAKTGKLKENEIILNGAVAGSVAGIGKEVKKLKNENIKPIEIVINTSSVQGSKGSYEEKIAELRNFADNVATTADQVKLAEDRIKALDFAKALKFDPSSLFFGAGGFTKLLEEMQAKVAGYKSVSGEIKTIFYDLSAEISTAVEQLAENAAVGFGEAIGGVIAGTQSLGSLFSGMLGLVANFMKDLGKQLIAIGIARIAFDKLKFSGIGAVVAGIALVALSTVISSKFENAGRFESGGVVGGSSFYGDKILARVNSGELILNQKQQANLYGSMNTTESGFVSSTKIQGSDLLVIIERANARKNRIG